MTTCQRDPRCSMRADGQTVLKKSIVSFVNFTKARESEEQMLSRSKKKKDSALFPVLRAILIRQVFWDVVVDFIFKKFRIKVTNYFVSSGQISVCTIQLFSQSDILQLHNHSE